MSTRVNDLWVADFEYCENNNVSDEIAKLRRPMKYLKIDINGSTLDLDIKCVHKDEIILQPVVYAKLDVERVVFEHDVGMR